MVLIGTSIILHENLLYIVISLYYIENLCFEISKKYMLFFGIEFRFGKKSIFRSGSGRSLNNSEFFFVEKSHIINNFITQTKFSNSTNVYEEIVYIVL